MIKNYRDVSANIYSNSYYCLNASPILGNFNCNCLRYGNRTQDQNR